MPPPHAPARPAQCGDQAFRDAPGAAFPSRTFTRFLSEWVSSARAKGQAALQVKLNALFPPLFNRGARGGGACLSGTGRRGQGRGRRTDPRGGRATCTRRASGFRLPSGPEPPLQGRGNPVGAGWEGNAGRAPLAAIFFRLRAKSPDLLSASGDFQQPCSILKHPTWVFPQTRLGYFRR